MPDPETEAENARLNALAEQTGYRPRPSPEPNPDPDGPATLWRLPNGSLVEELPPEYAG